MALNTGISEKGGLVFSDCLTNHLSVIYLFIFTCDMI